MTDRCKDDPSYWCSDHGTPRYYCGCPTGTLALSDDADPGPVEFSRIAGDGKVTIRTRDAVILMHRNAPLRPGLRRRLDEHTKTLRETLAWSV